jgi:NAD(P)-dependent dehydrogenase (short-subunit alcohol dehydrogenase family)
VSAGRTSAGRTREGGKDAELAGRTALVTGAGRGIGRGVALELARAGARVVLVGRRAEALEATRRAIEAEGGQAAALAADIREEGWLARLDEIAPAIDLLVNNAVSFPPYGALEEVPGEAVDEVLDTVVRATLRLVAHVIGGMKQRGFGRIVNVGTVAASRGALRQAPYATAKAALGGLTRSVALEGARHGVTCNELELGLILTERIADAVPEDVQRALVANTAAGRPGTVEEVAAVVRFLCSPRASYVTGATIPVSGGFGLGLFPGARAT